MFEVYSVSDFCSIWYFAGFALTGYISYYLTEVVQQPVLACGSGKYRDFLEQNLPILREKFWPTFWCCESRLQTIFAHYIRELCIPNKPYRREVLIMSDGGQVALDWRDNDLPADAPILVALPGLTGCSDVEYMQNIAHTTSTIGIRCVVFNNRGLGGLQMKTPLAYCATYVEDISTVVKHVRSKYPNSPIAALGVSMGGLIVGNYVSTKSEEAHQLLAAAVLISPPWNVFIGTESISNARLIVGNYVSTKSEEAHQLLAAAVLISPPWNVFIGTESIEKPILNNLLNRQLATNLIQTFNRVRPLFENKVDCNAVTKSRSVKEFDTNFTSKVFGFRDIIDYYTNASIHDKIPTFKVPTLCLSAADDPFQPLHGIPVEAANKSQNVAIVIPSRGGHIGFMEGILPFSANQYMQRIVAQYLSAILFDENYAKFRAAAADPATSSS